MKKALYFIGGVFLTLIVTAIGVNYYLNTTDITIYEGNGEFDLSTISDEHVEQAVADKTIDRITLEEYNAMSKTFTNKTLVTFWTSWCGSCLKEIPKLKAYSEKENIDLIFINFDKQSTSQSKVVLNKMENLNLEKTYQLTQNDKFLDPTNHRMLASFLDDRNIKLDTLGLPVNIIYENGVHTNAFTAIRIDKLYTQQLDEHFK